MKSQFAIILLVCLVFNACCKASFRIPSNDATPITAKTRTSDNSVYYQSDVITATATDNVYQISVTKQTPAQLSATPGLLYIIDAGDTPSMVASNIRYFISTDCSSKCDQTLVPTPTAKTCGSAIQKSLVPGGATLFLDQNKDCTIYINFKAQTGTTIKRQIYLSGALLLSPPQTYGTPINLVNILGTNQQSFIRYDIYISNIVTGNKNVGQINIHFDDMDSLNINEFYFGKDADATCGLYPVGTICKADYTTPTTNKKNYKLTVDNTVTVVHAIINVKNNNSFKLKYDVTCTNGELFDYNTKKCPDKVDTNVSADTITLGTKDYVIYHSGTSVNKGKSQTFRIDAQPQAGYNSAFPGMIYISDTSTKAYNLQDPNVKIYVASECNTNCKMNIEDLSSTTHCNAQLVTSNSVIYMYADVTTMDSCSTRIQIDVDANYSEDALVFDIKQFPKFTLTASTQFAPFPSLDLSWKADLAYIIFEIDLNVQISSTQYLDYIETTLENVDSSTSAELYYGTNEQQTVTGSACSYTSKFPSEANQCKASTSFTTTKKFSIYTNGKSNTQLYLFLKLKNPNAFQTTGAKFKYNIKCSTDYQFDQELQLCIQRFDDSKEAHNYVGTTIIKQHITYSNKLAPNSASLLTFPIHYISAHPEQDAVPSILYIYSNDATKLTNTNILIYMTTTCQTADTCAAQSLQPSKTNHCGFITTSDSIWYTNLDQNKECQVLVYIVNKPGSSVAQFNYHVDILSFYPGLANSKSIQFTAGWQAEAPRVYQINFNSGITAHLNRLEFTITGLKNDKITKVTYGNGVGATTCATQFPSSSACDPETSGDNYVVKTSNAGGSIYLFIYATSVTTSFEVSYKAICADTYLLNSNFQACLQTVTVPELESSTFTSGQKYYDQTKSSQKNRASIYTINVKKQATSINNAIPGILYVSKTSNTEYLGGNNIQVYLATDCNSQCSVTAATLSESNNCNNLFSKSAAQSNLWSASMSKEDQVCSITIRVDVKTTYSDTNIRMSLIPLRYFTINGDHVTASKNLNTLNNYWPNSIYGQRVIQLSLTAAILDYSNVEKITVHVNGLSNTYSKSLTYGTDRVGQCYTKYPSSNACSPNKTTSATTTDYSIDVDATTKAVYAFMEIQQSATFYSYYEVICEDRFQFDYYFNKCFEIDVSNIKMHTYNSTFLTYQKNYYQQNIIAMKGYANIFHITIPSYSIKERYTSAVPGVLYITSSDSKYNLNNEKIKIYMSTSCGNCAVSPDITSTYMNCNELFKGKFNSVYYAMQYVKYDNCEIQVGIIVDTDSTLDYALEITQIPIISFINQHEQLEKPYPVDIYWQNDDYAVRLFDINTNIPVEKSAQIKTITTTISNIPDAAINSIYYGDGTVSCPYSYPFDIDCVPTKTTAGAINTYKVTTGYTDSYIRIAMSLKKTPDTSFFITYDVECEPDADNNNYKFEYIYRQCIKLDGAKISQIASTYAKKPYQNYIIAQKAMTNTFTVTVAASNNLDTYSLPGTLYLTDNEPGKTNNLQDANLNIYIVTDCDATCTKTGNPSADNNCNSLFTTKKSSVFAAPLNGKISTTTGQQCTITIVFDQKSQDQTFQVTVYPQLLGNVLHTITGSAIFTPFVYWKTPDAGPLYYIFDTTFQIDSSDHITTMQTNIRGYAKDQIANIYFGTNNPDDKCESKFPNSDGKTTCVPTVDKQNNYLLQTSHATTKIYVAIYQNANTAKTSFSTNLQIICEDKYLFHYNTNMRKCSEINAKTIAQSKTTVPYNYYLYSQTDALAERGRSNTWTINVAKQDTASESTLPGVLYISSRTDTQNLNNQYTDIFIVSSCTPSSVIADATKPAYYDNQNPNLLNQKDNSVFSSYQKSGNTDCQIGITVQISDSTNASDLDLKITLVPVLNFVQSVNTQKDSIQLHSYWPAFTTSAPSQRIVKLDYTKIVKDYERISQVITYITDVPKDSIQSLTYGTNDYDTTCRMQFPDENKGQACTNTNPTAVTGGYTTYKIQQATRSVQYIYLFFNLKTDSYFKFRYEVICQNNYIYNYDLEQCIKLDGSRIEQSYQKLGQQIFYEDYVYIKPSQTNTFSIEVANQQSYLQNAVPGVLYISDNIQKEGDVNNLNSEYLSIYMTTNCNSKCTQNPNIADINNDCSSLFNTKLNSVYTMEFPIENSFCKVTINFKSTAATDSQVFLITLLPIQIIEMPKISPEIPLYPAVFWKSDYAQVNYDLNFDSLLTNFTNVVNLKAYVSLQQTLVKDAYFGTDNKVDKCDYKFPNKLQTCAITTSTKGIQKEFQMTVDKSTRHIYLSLFMNGAPDLYINYYVICDGSYVFNPTKNYCVAGQCPAGEFLNVELGQCENCPANCITCSTSSTCETCVSNYEWSDVSKTCVMEFAKAITFNLLMLIAALFLFLY